MTTTVTDLPRLGRRDRWPVIVTVLALLAWSGFAYLTVRVDGDIVAEVIQVQRWLAEPFWVLSYPGQLYGGVLEYPLIMLAETIAPGNVYGFTLLRMLCVPLVGLLMCVSVRSLSPSWSLWPMALAAVAGPAVLHGFMPIKDLYPFGWLVAAAGIALLYRQSAAAGRPWLLLLGGVLVGLGIYQHPTTMLFSLPMVAAGWVHWRVGLRRIGWTVVGIALGLVPLVMALTMQPGKVVVYESTKLGLPQVVPALGLSTAPDAFAFAIVPNAWGVQFTDINTFALPAVVQLVVNILIAAWIVLCVVWAVPAVVAWVRGQAVPPRAFVAVLWATFLVMLVLLTTLVRPVFYYGAAVGFLVWVTLAALPSVLARTPRLVMTWAVIGLMAVTSLGSVLAVEPLFPRSIPFKYRQAQEVRDIAAGIEAGGVPFVYGTYWEVLPIVHASSGRLQPLTSATSRFPAPPVDGDRITVAVPDGYTVLPVGLDRWPGAEEALTFANGTCTALPDLTATMPAGISAFSCPAEFTALATGAQP